jgi:hypothetical protein
VLRSKLWMIGGNLLAASVTTSAQDIPLESAAGEEIGAWQVRQSRHAPVRSAATPRALGTRHSSWTTPATSTRRQDIGQERSTIDD